jgi:hypothetical protein
MSRRTQQTMPRLAGMSGALLLAVSLAGVVSTQLTDVASTTPRLPKVTTASVKAAIPIAGPAEPAKIETTPAATETAVVSHDRYPLAVGRFWVYRHQEPGSDVVTEIERVIVDRKVQSDGKQVFIFDDGGVVYTEDGKVFEMGSSGGVNIIPVTPGPGDSAGTSPPVVYRSQGMQIEKRIAATDTSLVVAGRRFDHCLEIITHFRALEDGVQDGTPKGSIAYSSFYAPGIGMVGRQGWPRDEQGSMAVILADHGSRQL